jgi:hypothetical protein
VEANDQTRGKWLSARLFYERIAQGDHLRSMSGSFTTFTAIRRAPINGSQNRQRQNEQDQQPPEPEKPPFDRRRRNFRSAQTFAHSWVVGHFE